MYATNAEKSMGTEEVLSLKAGKLVAVDTEEIRKTVYKLFWICRSVSGIPGIAKKEQHCSRRTVIAVFFCAKNPGCVELFQKSGLFHENVAGVLTIVRKRIIVVNSPLPD